MARPRDDSPIRADPGVLKRDRAGKLYVDNGGIPSSGPIGVGAVLLGPVAPDVCTRTICPLQDNSDLTRQGGLVSKEKKGWRRRTEPIIEPLRPTLGLS